jgi:hypothetical protein
LLTGRLSWRRLGVLVRHLPPGCAVDRAQHGEAAEWGHAEHLLADLRELLRAANWQRGGDKKVARPKPLPRPGDRERVERKARETRDRLLAQRARLKRRG